MRHLPWLRFTPNSDRKSRHVPRKRSVCFSPGWLLMSALSACGGDFEIFNQKIFVRYLQVCVEPVGPVHPPPEDGPREEGHPCSAPRQDPERKLEGFC